MKLGIKSMKLNAPPQLTHRLFKARLLAVASLTLWFATAESRAEKPASVPGQEFTAEIQVSWMNSAWSVFFANKGKQPALDDWWLTEAKWETALKSREALEKLMTKKDKSETLPVTFKLWVPEGVKCIQGLVVASGHGTGATFYKSDDLRKIAAELHLGLLTFIGQNMQRGFWPTSLFYDQVKGLSQASSHPELENVPLFLYGHSNGTGFSGIFPGLHPDRVWGWISMRPGAVRQVYQPKAATVPGMVMFGEKDHFFYEPSCQQNIGIIGGLRKEHSSMVHMVVQPGQGHSPDEKAWELVHAFIKESFAARVPADSDPLKGPVKLTSLKLEDGYLGQNWGPAKGGKQELPVMPYSEFKGDMATTSWLINAAYAKAWQELQR
jgi:hypothetical protein